MSTELELVELQQTLYTLSNPTRRWLHCTRRDWISDAFIRTTGDHRQREIEPESGIYIPVLAQLYDAVLALDIEQAYLNHVSHMTCAHQNLELKVDGITASGLPNATFDLILCT